MNLLSHLSKNAMLRSIALPLLRRVNFDFTLRHVWVGGARLKVNSFRHKGYWFFGRNRELKSMELFGELIAPGQHVVEVGGHVGFITAYFAKLVGPTGHVTVFEPGSNNLPYIRRNIAGYAAVNGLAPIALVEKAVGPQPGIATFYEDDLTGQNNSIVESFDVLTSNARSAHVQLEVKQREVELVAIDHFFVDQNFDFIKIDVEGFELGVLQGMAITLAERQPVIMIEVQAAENEILTLLKAAGYRIFSEQRAEALTAEALAGNMFALHSIRHASVIARHFSRC